MSLTFIDSKLKHSPTHQAIVHSGIQIGFVWKEPVKFQKLDLSIGIRRKWFAFSDRLQGVVGKGALASLLHGNGFDSKSAAAKALIKALDREELRDSEHA